MTALATAVIGSAVIGGVAANQAAGKSADAAKKGIESTERLANQARTDAINLFQQSKTSAQGGINAALNFYKNNAQAKIDPYVKGNMQAQQVLGKGATQAQNAILGLPVDLSFANQPSKIAADYTGIKNAKLPTLGASTLSSTAPTSTGGQGNASGIKKLVTGDTERAAFGGALGSSVLGSGFRGIF